MYIEKLLLAKFEFFFFFFNLNPHFPQNILQFNILLSRDSPPMPNLLNCFKYLQSYVGFKN